MAAASTLVIARVAPLALGQCNGTTCTETELAIPGSAVPMAITIIMLIELACT